MCTSNTWDYKKCKQASTGNCHQKIEARHCFGWRAGLYANSYHPVRVINCIKTQSGNLVHPIVDEICPICYPDEALAERERRKREAERRAARQKKRELEDAERAACATPDLTECMDPFSDMMS